MRLSTRARYAARIMVCITTQEHQGPVSKQRIADLEDLSPDYVEQILVSLRNAGLVHSHRGIKGGFTTARDPSTVTITDVLTAVEGPIALVPPAECTKTCGRIEACITRTVWAHASQMLTDFFSGITVQQLADEATAKTAEAVHYHI